MKAAVKRKQRQILTHSGRTKHRRSRASLSAEDIPVIGEGPVDRSMVEGSAKDAWTDTETKAVKLRLLLEHERKQTDDFEAYLRRALSDKTPSPTVNCRLSTEETVCNNSDARYSLSEQMSQLQDTLVSEREANRLFEFQLMQICLYD